jgi:hypothetical protein
VTRHRLAALGAALLAALPISLAAQTFQGKIRFRTVQIAVGEDDARPAAPDPALKLRALGQTRPINGMRAAGYEVRGEDFVIRAWMTQDHPGLTWTYRKVAVRDEGEVDPVEIARALLSRHGFPVLLQVLTSGSLELEETVSVERAPLGDAPFRVPAGFKKQEMPGGP